MRHKVVHDYLGIDDDIVWQVATEDLPELVASLEARDLNEHPVERGMTHAAIHSPRQPFPPRYRMETEQFTWRQAGPHRRSWPDSYQPSPFDPT